MTQKYDASSSVVRRLPRYYRLLGELERSGQVRTSSRELGRRLGMTASQIRQDLCCFGCFGQQGSGYSVAELRENLQRIMGLSEQLPAIVVGAGSLGKVVSENVRFEQRGFRLVGIFDIKPELTACRAAYPVHGCAGRILCGTAAGCGSAVSAERVGADCGRAAGLSGCAWLVEFQPLRSGSGKCTGRDHAPGRQSDDTLL